MSNCEYCKKGISEGSLRCFDCNFIWSEGSIFGQELIKSKLKEIVNHIKNLTGVDLA